MLVQINNLKKKIPYIIISLISTLAVLSISPFFGDKSATYYWTIASTANEFIIFFWIGFFILFFFISILLAKKPFKVSEKSIAFVFSCSLIITIIIVILGLIKYKYDYNNYQKNKQKEKNEMRKGKFEWKPTECAPLHYASEIYHGNFITDDDSYVTIPYGGTIDQGWGNSGSSWAVGEDLKPVPSHLKIIWISFTENQFYYLDTKLPKQKMIELFEKGFINDLGKQDTYDNIVVGLAPGGAVSVWLMNATYTTEVGHYQAIKTDVDMKDFKPDGLQDRDLYIKHREESFSEETKKVLAAQDIPIGKWTAFRQRFLWKPVVKHAETLELELFYNDLYNGESYSVSVGNPILDDYQNYPPPKDIAFYWYDKNKNNFGCKIQFDEKEIWNAFKKIFANKETKQAELVFKIDKYNSNVTIFLKSENNSIKIEKAKIKTYVSSD